MKTIPICMRALASFESGEDVLNSSGEKWNQTLHYVGKSLGKQVHLCQSSLLSVAISPLTLLAHCWLLSPSIQSLKFVVPWNWDLSLFCSLAIVVPQMSSFYRVDLKTIFVLLCLKFTSPSQITPLVSISLTLPFGVPMTQKTHLQMT